MKPLQKSLLIALALSPFTPLAAHAALVRDAPWESACQGDIPLVVHTGMGAAIDFTQTGKAVQRAWLGDPSKVTLDTDRPMSEGSSVLFLRRIEGISFEGLPATASTVLTTVLVGAGGTEVCQFPISYSSALPDFTSLRLLPEREALIGPVPDGRPSLAALRDTSVDLGAVEAAIDLNALTLGDDSPVIVKLRAFVERAEAGGNQQAIAQEMEIEWPLILELRRQGERIDPDTVYAGDSAAL